MKPEVIKDRVFSLPLLSSIGRAALRHERWEADDGYAHFWVTRYLVLGEPEYIATFMEISGMESEQERIVREFSAVLGNPEPHTVQNAHPHVVNSVTWISKQIRISG